MSDFVEVRIYGQTFKLRAGAGKEYIQELAGYVDGIMETISRKTRSPSPDRVAVMTALDIADTLFQHRRQRQNEVNAVNEKIRGLIVAADRLLEG